MSTAKEEVKALLDKVPDDCSLEDVPYHHYAVVKIHRGTDRRIYPQGFRVLCPGGCYRNIVSFSRYRRILSDRPRCTGNWG